MSGTQWMVVLVLGELLAFFAIALWAVGRPK